MLIYRNIISVLQRTKKNPHHFRRFIRKTSTVELAHKIYGSTGANNPIIILHGLLGSKRNWGSMAEKLQTSLNRAVITVDLRNHGYSPHSHSHQYPDLAADIKRLLEKLSLKEAIVIGHSMGGRTAMVLALTEPTKVSHLIVVDISPVSSPNVLNDFFPRLIDVMKTIKFDDVKDIAAARGIAKQKLETSSLSKDLDIGMINFVLTNVGKRDGRIAWMCNMDALKNHFVNIASFPTEMAGKIYKRPTLFIAGVDSYFVPKEDLGGIQNFFPLAQLEYVDQAGHNVHMDKPDEFLKLISTFLTK